MERLHQYYRPSITVNRKTVNDYVRLAIVVLEEEQLIKPILIKKRKPLRTWCISIV